ncbi:Festuclavine dehydrogenase [Aspergillus egyptiacus]|nr:Festuclavine dehydrogenase [Aspergillus egyptiacus]
MTILVLGGRGKTASHLASLLAAADVPFLLATSSPSHKSPYSLTHFNWLDEATYESPFIQTRSTALDPISAVYLVAPPIQDVAPPMLKFIDLARARGVKRFVLLSASNVGKGGHSMGQAHAYLDSLGDVEYVALRPTWFMENLLEDPHLSWIKSENKIYSATGNGKIPFISAYDIARVAFHVLTQWKPREEEYLVLGQELLSYDKVAEILTTVMGREISHVSLPQLEFAKLLTDTVGLPVEFASMLADMEAEVGSGGEERLSDAVARVTGSSPLGFRDFVVREKDRWL